jgi:hypothetical protein
MMITATCNTDGCEQHGIGYNIYGAPAQVMCGACRDWCDLTDLRDDPPEPDGLLPEPPAV